MTHLASIYKPSWKEAAGNKNYHHPPLHCANDDHFDFNIVTIMTIYNSQNGAASSPPNNLLADSATAGTKRLKPCGCLCCLIIYSWQYQRGMILFNVKYTRMSIWASCLETCWTNIQKLHLDKKQGPRCKKRIIHLNLATASGRRLRLSPSSVSQISSHSPFGACAKSAEVLKVLPWNFCSKIDPKVLNRFWQSCWIFVT